MLGVEAGVVERQPAAGAVQLLPYYYGRARVHFALDLGKVGWVAGGDR